MEILGFSETQFFGFLLVLIRVSALFTFAPIFSNPSVPVQVRAAISLGLSLALVALGVGGEVAIPAGGAAVALLVVQEMLLGFLLGYVARLIFTAVQFAGQVVGFEMGLGIVSVFDPMFENQISIISQFQFLTAVLLFLAVGGDRMVVEAFARNFELLPPGQLVWSGQVVEVLVRLTGEIFRAGLQLAAPVIVALFATNVLLGIFARSVPQMNMLVLGFPLKIMTGFILLGVSLPYWGRAFLAHMSETLEALRALPLLLR